MIKFLLQLLKMILCYKICIFCEESFEIGLLQKCIIDLEWRDRSMTSKNGRETRLSD